MYDPFAKIKTPIDTLNIIGAGGILESSMVEIWGNPRGGKSTFCYQTAEMFMEAKGEGARLLILDSENSANELRLKLVFNLDLENDNRIKLAPAFTLEQAMTTIIHEINELEEGCHLLAIWDSITTSQSRAEYESVVEAAKKGTEANQFAGGMMSRPRVLRFTLNNILQHMWRKPVTVLLINQATTSIGRYVSREDSAGGYGLKHNIHYRLNLSYVKAIDDGDEFFRKGTVSELNINKSKAGPAISGIPVFIHDDLGGKISIGEELPFLAQKLGLLVQKGGWYSINTELLPDPPDKFKGKSFRFTDVANDDDMRSALREAIVSLFRKNYYLIDQEYKMMEEANNATD